jgi:hypothetical protein
MDFLKAMQQVLPCWYMYQAGSNGIIPMFLHVPLLNSMPMGFYQPAQIIGDA